MKNKKTLFSVCALLSVAVFALPACGETAHEHTFSDTWSKNATDHWHAATCEHTDQISGKQPHLFEDGKCIVCDYPDPDYTDKDKPGTGDTDKDNPDSDDPGEENPGEDNPDKDNPGTENPDKDNPGEENPGEDNPGTDDPEKDKPSTGDTDENNLTDEIFEGNFTSVTAEADIDRLEDYLEAMTRKMGAGGGFTNGDLYCRVLEGNAVLLNYTLTGLEGDISSSKNLSFKQNLRAPNSGGLSPVNCFAKGDYAYEEYETDILAYQVKDGCLALAKNVIYNIWGTFSITPSLFEHDIQVSYRTEGDYTILKLDVTNVSNVEGGYGSYGGVLTEQVTVEYVLLDKKIAGLNYFSHSELMYDVSMPPALLGDMSVRVLMGNYSFEIPDVSGATEAEGQPDWVASEKYPEESIFDNETIAFNDLTAQNIFGSLVSTTRSRAMGGFEAVFTNSNYHVQTKIGGKEDREMIFDLYNADGIKIKSVKDGEVILTDGTKSVVEKDGKKTEGASRVDELYDIFEDDYEDILDLLMTYAADYTTGTYNYGATYYMNDDFFCIKFTEEEDGEVVHETTYVFSMSTSALLAAKDVETMDDGAEREITVLCGEYKVEI